jgi:ketosteroid isomerase-like protein
MMDLDMEYCRLSVSGECDGLKSRNFKMDIVERPPHTAIYRIVAWRLVLIAMIVAFSIGCWEGTHWVLRSSAIASSRVHDVLARQKAAWNEGDLDGFMLGYWNDPELTFYSDNTIEKGYEPLKQRYFKRYKAEGKEMGKLTFSDVDVHPKSETFAVVRGHWKVEKSKETAEGLFTLWIEKKPEGWRIVHDHTSAAPKP